MRGKGFFCIFKHPWAPKRSWKIYHGGPGFFISKKVGTLGYAVSCAWILGLNCPGSKVEMWHRPGCPRAGLPTGRAAHGPCCPQAGLPTGRAAHGPDWAGHRNSY